MPSSALAAIDLESNRPALRVARRFRADTLTKKWLMGVKRGWNAVIESPHEPWDKFTILREFLKNLREQVLYQKHGMEIVFEGSEGRNKFEGLVTKTREKLEQQSEVYETARKAYWAASDARDEEVYRIEKETGDQLRRMGSEEFIQKHPDFKPFQERFVATMDVSDRWRWHPQKAFGPLTRTFEELMKFLYSDAMSRAEYEQSGGSLDDSALSVERVFDLEGIKVVILSENLARYQIRDYIKYLNRAHQLLAQKGFGKLWSGVIFVESEYQKKTDEEVELGKRWGYNNAESAGHYYSGNDRVYVHSPPNSGVAKIVVHELGHRYWYKFMKPAQRARFNDLVRTKKTEKYRDYPQGPTTEDGQLKPVAPLGDYAESNIEEAFAEVFEEYVVEGELDRDQLESFRSVLSRRPFSPQRLCITETASDMTTEKRISSCGSRPTLLDSALKTTFNGLEKSSSAMVPISQRVAARYLVAAGYFHVGDFVWMGKYKNKLGQIISFGEDEKGNPVVTIRPVPQGRKQDKTFSLFKIWKVKPEQFAALKAKGKLAADSEDEDDDD